MNIYPDFYNEFQCIGQHCKNTCCADWKVYIDNETFQRYQQIQAPFGQFIRENLVSNEKGTTIKWTKENRCPFLDEQGLCRIQLEYGFEFLCEICRRFPRKILSIEHLEMKGLSLSCEQVLRILYEKDTPIKLFCNLGKSNRVPNLFENHIRKIHEYTSFGMDLLQNMDIPFGCALGSLLIHNTDIKQLFNNKDYDKLPATLNTIQSTLSELEHTRQEMTYGELEQIADQLLFVIVDTFCSVVRELNYSRYEKYVWDASFFELTDAERKGALSKCRLKQKQGAKHQQFMRHLAANNLFTTSMAVSSDPEGSAEYFSRLVGICRVFEQSKCIEQFVFPILDDLFHPDLLSYTMALMVCFDY